VFFTPDWSDDGMLCLQAVDDVTADPIELPCGAVQYPTPCTAAFLFQEAQKLMAFVDSKR
jgi:hypothetical protein